MMDGQRDAIRSGLRWTAAGLLLLLAFAGCEGTVPADRSRAKVVAGIRQLDRNEYDAAIASFTEAIQTDGGTAAAHHADPFYYRGMAYVSKGLTDKAIDDFTRAISIDHRYARAYCGRGIAFKRKGLVDIALVDFSKAIALNPRYVEPRWRRGQAYLDTGSYDRAVRDALRAIQLAPQQAIAFGILGSAFLARRAYRKATVYLDEAIRIDPTLAKSLDSERRDAYWDLAEQLAAAGKLADADAVDRRAATIWADWVPPLRHPSPPAGRLTRTTVHKPVVAAKPARSDRVARAALELVQAGEFDQAIAKLTQPISADPRSAPLHYVRGLAYLKKGQPDTAIEDFDRALAGGPRRAIGSETDGGAVATDSQPQVESAWRGIVADVYDGRGEANLQLGNPLTAARDCTQAILRRPDDARAYYLRGLAYLDLARFDRARADLSELKRLDANLAEKLRTEVNRRRAARGHTGRVRNGRSPAAPPPPDRAA